MQNKSANWFKQVAQRAETLGQQRLRVGVTGLSGAGKTTFITSLINQLENHGKGLLARRAPFDRLESVRWQRENVEQPFPYLDALAALSSAPARWPDSTSDLSRVVIDLRFRPQGLLRRVQPVRQVRIDILDYPGEWLLDLPLYHVGGLGVVVRCALAGATLNVTGEGDDLMVNDAGLVCGGVKTSNAVVYMIDTVLMPPAS